MSSRVQRGTFNRWCRTCGWKRTYDTAAKGDYAKRQHSCERWLRVAAAADRGRARKDSVDRTLKPCLHKIAEHQHGTRACYVLDACRCLPCSKANATAEIQRERQKAYGRYDKYVDAQPIRDHLQSLKDYGIGLKKVSELSHVSNGSLTKIWYGEYAVTGRGRGRHHGEGVLLRGPAKRVQRTTAERILAVERVPANLGPHRPDHERTPLARQHARALVALGYSMKSLAERLGFESTGNFNRIVLDDSPMYRATVDRIEALYAELCMTPPRADEQRSRISVSRSKRYACEHGWLPPLALDDLEVEHTDAELLDEDALVDDVAIARRMGGDKAVPLNRAEQFEVVTRLNAQGHTDTEIERRTGIHAYQVARDRRLLGLEPNMAPTKHPVPSTHFGSRRRKAQDGAA